MNRAGIMAFTILARSGSRVMGLGIFRAQRHLISAIPRVEFSHARSLSSLAIRPRATRGDLTRFKAARFGEDENNSLGSQTRLPPLKIGTEVTARISSFGPLGASVEVHTGGGSQRDFDEDVYQGLIDQSEISLFREARGGSDVVVGEMLQAWVFHTNEDGKIAVGLRPSGRERVSATQETLLAALERAPGNCLPFGDKSDPMLIRRWLPGISKRQFKEAVGGLFRAGIVLPSRNEIVLVPESERPAPAADATPSGSKQERPSAAAASSAVAVSNPSDRIKTNPWAATVRGDTVLVSGLPFKMRAEAVAAYFEHTVGQGARVVSVEGMQGEDGRPSGRAVVTFAAKEVPTSSLQTTCVHEEEEATARGLPTEAPADEEEEEAQEVSIEALFTLTVPVLKDELRSRGLAVSGLKAELVKRLKAHVDEDLSAAPIQSLASTALSNANVRVSSNTDAVAAAAEGKQNEAQKVQPAVATPPAAAATAEVVQKAVEAAMKCDGATVEGRQIKVRPWMPERPRASDRSNTRSSGDDEEGSAVGRPLARNAVPSSSSSSPAKRAPFQPVEGGGDAVMAARRAESEKYRAAREAGKVQRGGRVKSAPWSKEKINQKAQPGSCCFFGNLAYGVSEHELVEEIEAVVGRNAVAEVRPSPYGDYCHVDFTTPQAAAVAVREFNNFKLQNRPLRVDIAR